MLASQRRYYRLLALHRDISSVNSLCFDLRKGGICGEATDYIFVFGCERALGIKMDAFFLFLLSLLSSRKRKESDNCIRS